MPEPPSPVTASAVRASHTDPRLYLRETELDRAASLVLQAARLLERDAATGLSRANGDISAAERDVLLHLALTGAQTVSALGKAIDMPKPTLARVLNSLEAKAMLERVAARNDARRRDVRLTAQGQTLIEHGVRDQRARTLAAFRLLGPDSVSHGMQMLTALSRPSTRQASTKIAL
jgi:DNA-binding MarR family transcriptional regulator